VLGWSSCFSGEALARDLQPHKPNPYRLLALLDSKMGRCREALAEIDQFLQLTAVSDPRRAEADAIRQSCVEPPPPAPAVKAPAVRAPPPPAVMAPQPRSHALRNSAIVTVTVGGALLAVGVALLAVNAHTEVPGATLTAVGGVGVVLSIPLFVVNAY
jgi:hypothetical protein